MKILFAGVRWESCEVLGILAKNCHLFMDIITFKGSFIEKNISCANDYADKKLILPLGKVSALGALYRMLMEGNYDLCLSVGFPYILPKEFFGLETVFVNSHPHLLPEYRGNNAIRKSFERGESRYGVTLHKMTESADDGEIIMKKEVYIPPVNLKDIYNVLFAFIEPSVIAEAFPRICNPACFSNKFKKCKL